MGILKIDQKGIRFLKCSSTRSTSFWTWSTTSRSYVTPWTGKKSTKNTNAAIKRRRIRRIKNLRSLRRRKAQVQVQVQAKAKAKATQGKELAPTTFSTTSRSYVTPWTGKKKHKKHKRRHHKKKENKKPKKAESSSSSSSSSESEGEGKGASTDDFGPHRYAVAKAKAVAKTLLRMARR